MRPYKLLIIALSNIFVIPNSNCIAVTDCELESKTSINRESYQVNSTMHIRETSLYDMLKKSFKQNGIPIASNGQCFFPGIFEKSHNFIKIQSNDTLKYNYWNDTILMRNEGPKEICDLVTKCFLVSTKDSVLYYLNDHLWAFRKYEGYNGNYDLELHWNSDSIRHQLDETMNIFDGSWYTFARFIVKNGQIISIDTLSGIIDSDIPDKTAIQLFF